MNSFEMHTAILSFVLINMVSTLVLFSLWFQYRDRYKGIGLITRGYALQTVGYILVSFRLYLPLWLSLDVANAIAVAGLLMGLKGLQTYTGVESRNKLNYIFLLVIAVVHLFFRFFRDDMTTRYLIISVASLGFFVQFTWLMLIKVPAKMRNLTKNTGYVFIGFSIVALLKIVDFFINRNRPADYFNSGIPEGLSMMVYGILIIILTFSLVTMFSNNLLLQIRTQEEKFSTSFHTCPNAIVLASFPEGRIIEVNKAFLGILGYSADEIDGKTMRDLLVWNNQEDHEKANSEIQRIGGIEKMECEFRRKNGEIFTGHVSARPIFLGDEKCLLTSIFDVSEKQHYQELIKHERNLLRTLIDHLPDPVTIKDLEGRYLLNNQAHLHIIGAETQEEVLGRTTFDFFPGDDAKIYDEDDMNVLKSGKMIIDKVESAIHEETGFPYWHSTSKIPIRDKTGKAIQILTISKEITEQKNAQDALKESDEFNKSLLRTIPFGMDVVDETGTILFVGENFRKIIGYDVTGRKCWDIYCDNKKQCSDCPLTKGIKIGATEVYESHEIFGGKIFDIYHTGMMYHGKKAMLEIFHDITERKKAEGELIRSKEKAEESDRLKTAFLHNISHEIRTPMNAIVGFANLLCEPGLPSEEQKSFSEIISKSSHHLLSIVNDVIEISNVEAGRMKLTISDIDITGLLNDLLKQFRPKASEKNLRFHLEIPDSVPVSQLKTDHTKLMQVISNLLSNSFKFTLEGGITFGYREKSPYYEFFVSDTGIGIEYDQQTRIFDRFYQVDNTVTRSHEGTGIGLAISKAYVELMGGKIWLRSEPGKGTTFFFTIPFLKRNSTVSQQF